MNRYVERLARVVPPPARLSAPPNWPAVERSLGLTLPVPRRDFDEWHLFDGCLAHFLVAVLNREGVVPAFPDDFPYPDVTPTFTPYGY
ncbi:hypothetical protein M8C11_10420 [Micromonospora sp. CPM1]|uniref:hypothetical protein n=1 Tax=Micromonospora sp. CPM1 TaxID=2944809 RepID=UPI00207C24C7|nr:hypothetical protein [Micromonospora sp. CPM1]MCO1615133.1 hypothetical protein [Micromonospora sp. CPM1]